MWLRDLPSTSVNFPCDQETFCKRSSTFLSAKRSSVNICLLSVWPGDFPSTYINFPCHGETLRQLPSTLDGARRPSANLRKLSVYPGDLLSTAVNFLCGWETFHQLPSTFSGTKRLSVNFRQLSLRSRYLPSTFVNFLFCAVWRPSIKCHQPFVWLGDLPSTSISIWCYREMYRELPSTFLSAGRVCKLVSTLCMARSPFVNFTCGGMTLCQIPSTFRVASRPCIIFCQLSGQLQDLMSIFIKFSCD